MSPNIMPIVIAVAIRDEPPYEINGRVIPFAGNKAKLTAILIMACKPNNVIKPTSASLVKPSGSFVAFKKTLMTTKEKSINSIKHAIMPNSSATTAKMKSVCESGNECFNFPSPGPNPNHPPFSNDCRAFFI